MMRAVAIRARSELRSGWRSWLVLAVLIGLAGGVAMAAVSGARRTETAYPRFLAWSRAADVLTGGFTEEAKAATSISTIEHLPEVAQWARVDLVSPAVKLPSGRVATLPEVQVTTDLQNRAGRTIERFKLLSGRLLDPKTPNEAVVDFAMAGRYGLDAGSVIRVALVGPDGQPRGFVPVRVVGVVAVPTSFPSIGGSNLITFIEISPAFVAAHGIKPQAVDSSLLIRLRHGAAGVPEFRKELERAKVDVDVPIQQAVQTDQVQHSIRFEMSALWILSVLVAVAALVILGQALTRQLSLDARDFPVLGALGMSRGQLTALGVVRAGAAGLAAALLAVPVAILLSPLTPIGLARIAEPNPGIWVDPLVLIAGALAVAVLVPLAAAVPAWLAARSSVAGAGVESTRPSRLAGAASSASRSPVISTGIRFALEPGRGRTAVPVRSAIFGATLAVAALVASMLFWNSLGQLLQTPRLAGFAWNVFVAPNDGRESAKIRSILDADPAVDGYSRGGYIDIRIGDEEVFGVVTGGTGPASPVIVEGRAPTQVGEIALGGGTMRAEDVSIGDSVLVDPGDRFPNGKPVPPARLRVVGRVIVPPAPFGLARPDEGAAFTLQAFVSIDPAARRSYRANELPYLVRFKADANSDAALAGLQRRLPPDVFVVTAQPPGAVATLGRIAQVPLFLAIFLGAIALGTLAQVLVTSVRRRRRDLAMLKTLGFVQRQIRGTVAWQATTLALVALVIGVPVGIALGRWAWRAFAEQIGVVPAPRIGGISLLIAVPATILLALAVSFVPALLAARTKPAAVLRSE
jgi:hypothetical protein